MRTTVKLQLSDAAQTAALFQALTAAGVQGPDADEGLRIEHDAAAGTVTIDADKDVSGLLAKWTPPATADDTLKAAIAGATTLAQLRTVLAEQLVPAIGGQRVPAAARRTTD